MSWIGRDDNLPVTEMGLSEELVMKLTEKNIKDWDTLVCRTLQELAQLGLTPQEIESLNEAVGKHTQRS